MIRLDLIKQAVASAPGTGAISLGSGQTGFIGIQDHPDTTDGMVVEYIAIDGNNKEFGIGTYAATGDVLTRTWIQGKIESGVYSKNPGTGVNLTANAIIQCGPVATNMNFIGALYTSDGTTQSIPNNTATDITIYNTLIYDTNSLYSAPGGVSTYTIPNGATIAQVSAGIRFSSASAGNKVIALKKNGSVFPGSQSGTTGESNNTNQDLNIYVPPFFVSGGDTITAYANQSSGVAQNIGSGNTAVMWFAIRIIQ